MITITPRMLNFVYGNMQMNSKAFLLKKRLSFPPNYIQRRGTVSSDYDHAAQVELHAQEYANESKGSFSLKKIFPAEYHPVEYHLPSPPARSRG